MFAVQPSLTPSQARVVLESTARPFPTTSSDPAVVQCTAPQYDPEGNPIDQLECLCTIDTCGAGMLDAGAAVSAASTGLTGGVQAEGLWWTLPAGSESGWGINFAQQGDVIFATWFTYDLTGNAWWLSMTANKTGTSPDTYKGRLYATHGPAFSAVPFDPSQVTHAGVGLATMPSPTSIAPLSTILSTARSRQKRSPARSSALPKCTYSGTARLRQCQQLPGPVVGTWRRRVGLGHQCYAPKQHYFRDMVHLRCRWFAAMAIGHREQFRTGSLLRPAIPHDRAGV